MANSPLATVCNEFMPSSLLIRLIRRILTLRHGLYAYQSATRMRYIILGRSMFFATGTNSASGTNVAISRRIRHIDSGTTLFILELFAGYLI